MTLDLSTPLSQSRLRGLRVRWLVFAGLSFSLLGASYTWLLSWWQPQFARRWLLMAGFALLYLLGVLWRNLTRNHRVGETDLLPGLGLGNLLSLLRGLMLVLFCGFLFSPWPGPGWVAWLPGLLYTLAALPDFLDGIAARLTNHVTPLGETRRLLAQKYAIFNEQGGQGLGALQSVSQELTDMEEELNSHLPIGDEQMNDLFGVMQEHLNGIYEVENEALEGLKGAISYD